jgi:hypothetical protein
VCGRLRWHSGRLGGGCGRNGVSAAERTTTDCLVWRHAGPHSTAEEWESASCPMPLNVEAILLASDGAPCAMALPRRCAGKSTTCREHSSLLFLRSFSTRGPVYRHIIKAMTQV